MAENCKVYTPKEYVVEVLDAIGYINNLHGMTVLENSCGIGDILCTVVERYIVSSFQDGFTLQETKTGLELDICGTEIDPISVFECKQNLSSIAEKYGILDVNWNIIECDYLRNQMDRTFDYVIGNPPYIVYRDIEKKDQEYIRENFSTCKKWKFDYYYAFIEKSVSDLSPYGQMAYIVPYSLYRNEGSFLLRNLIKPYVTRIIDYTHSKKFPGVITSSTVLLLEKHPTNTFIYEDVNKKDFRQIIKTHLADKWSFDDLLNQDGQFVFGDYYNVCNTIATLLNKAFVLDNYTSDENFYYVGNNKVEVEIVKPAISRKKRKNALEVAIIFPYYFDDGKLMHYTEDEFKTSYPEAYSYLCQFKKDLENRASDKNAKWFEYGRSQSLTSILSNKLVLPSIGAKKITATIVASNTIPLAGFYVTAKDRTHTLEEAQRILESADFYSYLCTCGIFTTGHSRRVSVKDVLAYRFSEWV